jgi:cytochrome c553
MLFFINSPCDCRETGAMLARDAALAGLEIACGCHYHSGLDRPRPAGQPRNSLKNIVIHQKNLLLTTAVLLLGAAFCSPPAAAEGDAGRGKPLAYTCLGCHGIEGYRNAYPSYRVPKLGGQKSAYLVVALQGYRDGSRTHPTMAAQASSLSDQQIEDVAAYLASLGKDTVENGGAAGASLDAAQTCSACHGQNGISLSPTWPTLAGQHEDYLVNALNQYRDGRRKSPVMAPLAATLAEADVGLLARYYSRLEGLETTVVD